MRLMVLNPHDDTGDLEVANALAMVGISMALGNKGVMTESPFMYRPLVILVHNENKDRRLDLNRPRRAGFKVRELPV